MIEKYFLLGTTPLLVKPVVLSYIISVNPVLRGKSFKTRNPISSRKGNDQRKQNFSDKADVSSLINPYKHSIV